MANDRSLAVAGIYVIRNLVNGKVYVGSSNYIELRWWQHKSSLRLQKHANRHLQRAWNKYGSEKFEFSILEETSDDPDILIDRETHWFMELNAADPECGYNIVDLPTRKSGVSGWNHTDDAKKRIGEASKGNTYAQGEKSGIAKLTDHNILEIRALSKLGYSAKQIGSVYGVTKQCIAPIVDRRGWTHIPEQDVDVSHIIPPPIRRLRGEEIGTTKLSDDDVKLIRLYLADGVKGRWLASQFNVSETQISSIKHNKSRKIAA